LRGREKGRKEGGKQRKKQPKSLKINKIKRNEKKIKKNRKIPIFDQKKPFLSDFDRLKTPFFSPLSHQNRLPELKTD